MASNRVDESQFRKAVKQVKGHVCEFDSIWKKIYDTETTQSVKKKRGTELAKLNRKFGELRSQLRGYLMGGQMINEKFCEALTESCQLIEMKMAEFEMHEKGTIKPFSTEGLSQEAKWDPVDKAKCVSRDWLNGLVVELKSQIDIFEVNMEKLLVKKEKIIPPRVTHLTESIDRHKEHVKKLELILRLLDNDEEDFDEFADVNELYPLFLLDKIEEFKDLAFPRLEKGASIAVLRKKLQLGASLHTQCATEPTRTQQNQTLKPDLTTKTEPSRVLNCSVPQASVATPGCVNTDQDSFPQLNIINLQVSKASIKRASYQ